MEYAACLTLARSLVLASGFQRVEGYELIA